MSEKGNLKARPKATPSRIQENISRSKVIVDQKICSNSFVHIAETEGLSLSDLPLGDISVPLNLWLEYKPELKTRKGLTAVQIGADESPEELVKDLSEIDIVVLPFVSFVDGRPYSHAQKLRTRYHYQGQIRAIGDVKFDHLGFLTRVGINAFELSDGENYDSALRAFIEFSEVYQPAADDKRLIFSRRRTIH